MDKSKTHTAPPELGEPILGKTLVDLLYEACAQYENPRAFNQPVGGGWEPYALDTFRQQAEETAAGLLDGGLERGDHVALFLESDVYFCIADMGCLLAGIVDVPIYLSSAPEAVEYIIQHAESKALIVSDLERLNELVDILPKAPQVKQVIVAQMEESRAKPPLPEGVDLLNLDEVQAKGRARLEAEPELIDTLRAATEPNDLATLIYTSGTTGRPKGVMLSHENISFNALTAFDGLTGYQPGPGGETALSFLPLTHIFARALQYGFMAYASDVYFTTPEDLADALPKVRPTCFATVPRVLEKVYSRIQERMAGLSGLQRRIAGWSLGLAQQYELGETRRGLRYKLADRLVYRKWRQAVGGRVRYVISGGAALNAELANVFSAAGIPVFQGYGLTETSPVVAYNRPGRNRAGTVGEPLPGVEVMIAEDGEILTRGPHIMQGYYKEPEKTAEAIDADGWFHTGDIGSFTDEGFLRITDRKKSLFKLSTGKYVMPQPLENRLDMEGLVENAVVVGDGRKYTTALIFPEEEALLSYARSIGLDTNQPLESLLREPRIIARYQELVDKANRGIDHWSTIKRFVLIPEHLTIENGLLTPTLKVKRSQVHAHYEDAIEAMYNPSKEGEHKGVVAGD